MPHTAVHLSVTRRVLILVLTTSYLLLAVGNISYGGNVCDAWSGRNCTDASPSGSSGGSSGNYNYSGTGQEFGWDARPNILQSIFFWPVSLFVDFVMVPIGLLEWMFTGDYWRLDRVAAVAWNYCPLVVTARLLAPVGQAISSVSLPSFSLPSRPTPQPAPPKLSMKELALEAVREGKLAQSRGNWSAAERAYRRAIELNPKDWESHAELAHALQMQGSLIAAEHYARRAVELSPENADVRTTLGSILREQGRDSEAEQQFLTAIKLDPGNPKAEQALTALVKSQSYDRFFENPHPGEMDKVEKVLEAQALGQSKVVADQAKLIQILAASPGGALTPFSPGGVPASEAGLVPRDASRTGSNVDAGAQGKSAELGGNRAKSMGGESMSDAAQEAFDKSGDYGGTLVHPDKAGQRPMSSSSLAAGISDEAKNDPNVKMAVERAVKFDQHLAELRADNAQEIAKIKEQIKNGIGDRLINAAQERTLKNQDERLAADQAQNKEAIKKELKDHSYTITESATPDASKTTASGSLPDQKPEAKPQ